MTRKLRIWYPGAAYHITSRGNRKSNLFFDNQDYRTYLKILEETRKRYPFHLHSYCLMPNHVHLQLETIQDHSQYIMQMLNSRYAMYFNNRYDFVGHVFQGRYGSKLIAATDYELDVSKYIHLNPVEANIVASPEKYLWSSYAAYTSNTTNPHVRTDKILSYFSYPAKEKYRLFVNTKPEGGLTLGVLMR